LKSHRLQQIEERTKVGAAWVEKDLVFCGLHGDYFNPNYLLRVLKKVLVDAGLPHMRFHDLRHSAATILLSMNIHPKVVQGVLGHSTINMTLDTYSHVLPSMQKDVIDGWATILEVVCKLFAKTITATDGLKYRSNKPCSCGKNEFLLH
jgi:integrase